jgi:sugar/nucleoside kinase (ribokinase family)
LTQIIFKENSMQKELTTRAAARLSSVAGDAAPKTVTVGLDAFVDEIIRVVDRRASETEYTTIEQIVELGTRIIGAAGQSTNLELVVERVKLGGNGPIMANALAALGPQVTCLGPLGEGAIHPAFAEMGQHATLISLGTPGHTDALEFEDGKVMLGKLEPLNDVTWARLEERAGADLPRFFAQTDLVALVNWTMIPAMSAIWEDLLILLAAQPSAPRRFFFDLADPEKHSDTKVADACRLLARFQEFGSVILGLNEKEAFRVGNALGYTGGHHGRAEVRAVTAYVSAKLPVETVVVHPRAYAVVASGGQITADVDGPFVENPLISTGAGDHFNAGFCLGKLLGLEDDEAATAAVGTSGYYVRNAASPTLAQLAEFLEGQASG